MNEEKYVAAVEVASSKIIAVVGRAHEDGRMDIIACDQERCIESVRYGVIQNLEETSMRIARILERLERKPAITPRKISKLFVGLSGRSVRSITTEVKMILQEETEITDRILGQLRDQALTTAVDNSLEVVDAIPRIYRIGKQETTSPKGMIGNQITATFDLIVCRPELKRNLSRTLQEKLNIPIAGFIVTALATAQIVLKPDEKRLGCMLVDMGAETTTVSIYKNGHLLYFTTLPLGGRNITRDLTSLGHLLEEKAEEIKITSGNAFPRESPSTLNVNGVSMADVSNLIVARAEEIVANVIQQIYYAGLTEKELPAGIVCIGGASKLNGITDLMKQLTSMTVRRGDLPQYIRVDDTKCLNSEIMETAGVLYAGAMNSDISCLEIPHKEELPVTGEANEEERLQEETRSRSRKKSGKMSKWGERIAKFFSGPGEDDSDLIE